MLLERLKQETQSLHDEIERSLSLFDSRLTQTKYRRLLEKMCGYYRPIEDRLAKLPWQSVGFNWRSRRRTSLLESDLLAMGVRKNALSKLPRCTNLPRLDVLPEGLGCLYVLEGSTLGGQVIVRQLRETNVAAFPCAFFKSYGENVAAMWKSFGAFLTDFAAGKGEDDVFVQSACETFRTMRDWFSQEKERLL